MSDAKNQYLEWLLNGRQGMRPGAGPESRVVPPGTGGAPPFVGEPPGSFPDVATSPMGPGIPQTSAAELSMMPAPIGVGAAAGAMGLAHMLAPPELNKGEDEIVNRRLIQELMKKTLPGHIIGRPDGLTPQATPIPRKHEPMLPNPNRYVPFVFPKNETYSAFEGEADTSPQATPAPRAVKPVAPQPMVQPKPKNVPAALPPTADEVKPVRQSPASIEELRLLSRRIRDQLAQDPFPGEEERVQQIIRENRK